MSGSRKKRPADDASAARVSTYKAARLDSGRHDTLASRPGGASAGPIGSSAANAIVLDDESIAGDDNSADGLVDAELVRDLQETYDTELYGYVGTKIVGCRYYNGYVAPNEMVMARREPHNPYDRNAIQVLNVRSEQIGHIPRTMAEKLARFMDNKSLRVEAFATGEKGFYDCPVSLALFGTKDAVAGAALREEMKEAGFPKSAYADVEKRGKQQERERKKRMKEEEKLAKKRSKGLPIDAHGNLVIDSNDAEFAGARLTSSGQTMEEILKESETFNPRNVDEMVEKFGLKEEDLMAMPMADQPKGVKTALLPYQRQGLKWMLDRESPKAPQGLDESVQLWKRCAGNAVAYTNMATNFRVQGQPELARGAILADDMGLGKTLQVISLIVADKEMKLPKKPNTSSATLVVAPLSVMSNWTSQIEQHVKANHPLKVLYYYGPKKPRLDASTADSWDVVVTNYDTVRVECYGKAKGKYGVHTVNWRRVILDEGHNIRNPASKVAAAHYELIGQSRWVLTGTPIINTLKDLYSLVCFLRLTGGLDKFELFNGSIIRPLNQGREGAARLLRDLMQSICLRRKKEMKFIDLKLPELSEYIHRVDWTQDERACYDVLYAEAKGKLEEYRRQRGKAGANSAGNYRNVLELLLRLRQVCNHYKLVGQDRIVELNGVDEQLVFESTAENRAMLTQLLRLNIDAQEDCPVCLDTLREPVITLCTHSFCLPCIERVIETQRKCPMCRAPLNDPSLLVRPPPEREERREIEFGESSSKIDALMAILKASAADSKTVVFSQWTSFLDLVEPHLKDAGIKFTRLDGRLKAAERDAALEALDKDPGVRVMLASLGVCSVGLNLVAANQVVLADSWW